jgi:hypothetical protein
LDEYKDRIIDILILEGKQTRGKQVNDDELEFIDFITTSNYYLTGFDIWLLVQHFKIPTIFISTTKLLETNKSKNFFIGYGEQNDDFAFIIIPGIGAEKVPAFKLIETDKNEVFISLDKLLDCENKNEINEAFRNKIIIEDFLSKFDPSVLKEKKSKKKLIIEDDSQDEEEPVKKQKKQPKKNLIVESTSSVSENKSSSSKIIIKKGKTKKLKLEGIKPKTKKNKK